MSDDILSWPAQKRAKRYEKSTERLLKIGEGESDRKRRKELLDLADQFEDRAKILVNGL